MFKAVIKRVSRGLHIWLWNGAEAVQLVSVKWTILFFSTDAIYSFVWEFHQCFYERSSVSDTPFMRPVTFYAKPSVEMLMRYDGWIGMFIGISGSVQQTHKIAWTSKHPIVLIFTVNISSHFSRIKLLPCWTNILSSFHYICISISSFRLIFSPVAPNSFLSCNK